MGDSIDASLSAPAGSKSDHGFIVFSDIHGFSKVKKSRRDKVYRAFANELLPSLNKKVIQKFRKGPDPLDVFNTWGDGMMAVFSDALQTVRFLVKYRDFFHGFKFSNNRMPKMKPRIAAHFGPLFRFQDATLEGRPNVTGAHVILPARLEPMTRSGEIYVTKDFKDSARTSYQVKKKYVFDSLGMMRLAKDFGEDKVFRLRKRTDPKEIIDPIMALDLTNTLPRPKGPDDDEKKLLDSLGATRNPQAFQALVQVSPLIKDMSNRSGPFLFALATLLKSGGMYQKAIDALDLLENQVLKAEDLEIRPYQYDLKVLALKTDCLSRLRRYQEAANLIYGVFKANENDSNTLSMLAAQYKRHGLYATSDTTPSMRDRTLIDRALNLYKEAFRRDITAYYPAINAAYLGIMLGGKQSDEGRKLAAFVCKYWQEGWDIDAWRRAATERGEKPDWWLPVSVAEAQMLLEGDSLEALVSHFAKLVNELKPTWFEKASTREQIEIYGIVTGRIGQVQPILDILDPNG